MTDEHRHETLPHIATTMADELFGAGNAGHKTISREVLESFLRAAYLRGMSAGYASAIETLDTIANRTRAARASKEKAA